MLVGGPDVAITAAVGKAAVGACRASAWGQQAQRARAFEGAAITNYGGIEPPHAPAGGE